MIRTIGLGPLIALAGGTTSALLLRAIVQRRNAARPRIPDGGIDEAGWVTLGGLKQWVTVRGHDRAGPVLLFVHGGPVSAMSLMSYRMLAPWERRFTVVNWDQRGAGRTLGRHGKAGSGALTLEQMTADGLELVEHLLERLGKRRIILLGHSWGSVLDVEMIPAARISSGPM